MHSRSRLHQLAFFLSFLSFLSFVAQAEQAVSKTPEEIRASFLKIVDRPRVPLAPDVQVQPAENGVIREHFTYASDAAQRVPGILIKPANGEGRLPVVILVHGTSSTKESNLGNMKHLAAKGIIGVAIDGRYHGERTKEGKGDAEYCEAIHAAWKSGAEHPLYFDTVWDLMRLIDYLETRPDVDPKRIGIQGFSKGGIETFLVSAIDTRIAVSVPCIGVQSFKWGLENGAWKARVGTFYKAIAAIAKDENTEITAEFAKKFYDRMIPGIDGDFDGPSMLTLISPRPLFVINGDMDDKTPVPSVQVAADAATKAYHAANADEKFRLKIQEKTGHAVTKESQEEVYDWFVKWLKP